MYRFLLVAIVLLGSFGVNAQDDLDIAEQPKMKIEPIETFRIRAKVVGVLQGQKDLAVIQIIETVKNEWGLKVGDEVLTNFYFTTQPFKGDRQYPGVKSGDEILGDIRGSKNNNGVQVDYMIFRYQVLPLKESSEAPAKNESQK